MKSLQQIVATLRTLRKKNRERTKRELLILTAATLVLIVGVGIVFIGSLKPAKLEAYLPAEATVGFLELKDITPSPKLADKPYLQPAFLSALFSKASGVDVAKATQTFAQKPFGLVLIEMGDKQIPILFLSKKSDRQAKKFFQAMALPGEKLSKTEDKPYPVYYFPQSQPLAFVLAGPWIFISTDSKALQTLSVKQAEGKTLEHDPIFLSAITQLPKASALRAYLNPQKIHLNQNPALAQLLTPFQSLTRGAGVTIRQDQNGFLFNQYLNLDPQTLSLKQGYTDLTRFAYRLTDYIGSQDLVAYMGGANLGAEWQNTLETISHINPAYGLILEGLVRAQVTRIFSGDVDLRNDLYPLFEGEYALAIRKSEKSGVGVKLILGHNDRTFAEAKLKKVASGFRLLASQFAPKLFEMTLPDGTVSKELMADSDNLEEFEKEYENQTVYCLDVKSNVYGFCYTVTDELMILANNFDEITETIDLTQSHTAALSNYQPFRQTLSNLSRVSDEITFLNLQKISDFFKNSPYSVFIESALTPFDSVTWVKHYFEDGMSAEGYLLLK